MKNDYLLPTVIVLALIASFSGVYFESSKTAADKTNKELHQEIDRLIKMPCKR